MSNELGNNRSPEWYRAEVERLRAELELTLAQRNRLLASGAKLEAANAELRAVLEAAKFTVDQWTAGNFCRETVGAQALVQAVFNATKPSEGT